MVRSVIRFLYKEASGLHEAAYLLAVFAILSQILAFLRDRLLAHTFGAGALLDTYYAAFRIPDFLFVTVASVVSLSVIVPFIVERERQGKAEVKKFIDNIFSFFSILIIIVCALTFFLIPALSSHLFKGFSEENLHRAITLSRLLLLSPIFLGFSNLFGSLTQAYNRFFVYAFAPLLYNLGIILGILVLGERLNVYGVAIGVVVGAFLHMAVQVPFVAWMKLFPKFKLNFDFSSIRKVVTLSFPRTLTLSTNHIATIFLISMASLMTAGSISILSLSLNLQSVPLSIIGVSYSLAAFPTLTRHFSERNIKAFVSQMSATAKHIIFWSLPITAIFIVLRAQIVRVLLGSGHFNWEDTRLTAAAFALFSISSVFQSLMLLFVRAFYSAGHTKKPFLINLLCTVILMLCAYGFVKIFYSFEAFRHFLEALFKVEDVPGTVVLMLPLGYTIGTILNGIIHWIGFEKDFGGFSKEVKRTLFESLAASVLVGTGAYAGLNVAAAFFKTDTLFSVLTQGLFGALVGVVAGSSILYLLKSKEQKEVWRAIHKRFWKSKVIATDPEIV
ncbi:murein biosynthesis integral membrane protein MurJ [Candidatus Parcubacteria bacterium]|nr:murein biosynthesis integral membrane protein MurJ [Candidatus Parcubacteria bacterium]